VSAADRFWLAVQRRVAGLQPDVQAAILKAFKILRENLNESEIARLLDQGGLDRLFSAFDDGPFSDATIERAFLSYRQEVRNVVQSAFETTVRTVIPAAGKIDGVLGVAFDTLSPDVITAIRTMETKSLGSMPADVRDVVRAYVENGIRDGKNPRVIAKALRDIIGMSPTQAENAIKYRAKLEAKGTMSPAQVDRAVASYQKKAVALNAETNARTATLDAYKNGQRLAWKQATDAGIVEQGSLVKTWHGVLDLRERPEHIAMELETVPFDSVFSNGEMIPGDSTYNCRCVAITSVDSSKLQSA
jgi:hypothetical protein